MRPRNGFGGAPAPARRRARPIAAGLGATAMGVSLSIAVGLPAQAATVTVCDTGCDFTSIGAAVADAAAGDTITVAAGTYAESVTIDKALTILGPNAETSPNGTDPLTASTERADEAIIAPAAGDGPGIRIVGDVAPLTLAGLTFDLSAGDTGQRYLYASYTTSDVTLERNIFTGAPDAAEGNLVLKMDAQEARVRAVDNRFVGADASNGLRILNRAEGGQTAVTAMDNVWLDNAAWAMNISAAGTISGSITSNWMGNSTPSDGSDQFAVRQSGIILAAETTGLAVTDNVFGDIEDSAINLYDGFAGPATVENNTIDGYNNAEGFAAVRVRSDKTDVSQVVFRGNSFERPGPTSHALVNHEDAGTFDARLNWWGQESGPSGLIAGPNVQFQPWLGGTGAAGEQVLGVYVNGTSLADPDDSVRTTELIDGSLAPTISLPEEVPAAETSYYLYSDVPVSALPDASTLPFDPASATVLGLAVGSVHGADPVAGPYTICVDGAAPDRLWSESGDEWIDVTDQVLSEGSGPAPEGRLCGDVPSLGRVAVAPAAKVEPAPVTLPEPTADQVPAFGSDAWVPEEVDGTTVYVARVPFDGGSVVFVAATADGPLIEVRAHVQAGAEVVLPDETGWTRLEDGSFVFDLARLVDEVEPPEETEDPAQEEETSTDEPEDGTGTDELPITGNDSAGALLGLTAGLLAAGGAVLALRRREHA